MQRLKVLSDIDYGVLKPASVDRNLKDDQVGFNMNEINFVRFLALTIQSFSFFPISRRATTLEIAPTTSIEKGGMLCMLVSVVAVVQSRIQHMSARHSHPITLLTAMSDDWNTLQ